ncbi:MAG: ABC-2 family transporter protein [Anaerolineales bacterium]|nr:ABC-2 family transporter protein [Anaerolineales bacterium]
MLRIYQRLWQVTWAEQWQYRANLIMYLLYWLVSPVVYLAVWSAIAEAQGSVNGLTANDFATYYLTLLIVDQLTSEITIHAFGYKVQDGSLSGELIRPAHPLLTNTLVYNLAFKALSLLGLVPVWAVLFALFQPDYGTVTLANLLLALLAIGLGFGISFLLGAALTCVAFWTTRVWALYELYAGVTVLFSGQFVPLSLMPPAIQTAAQFLPFQMFKYVPVQIILGRLTWPEVLGYYALGLAWLAAAWLLFRWVWSAGLKRYSAVGA